MADSEPSKSWWQTLPGLITSLAAAITAIAGLLVAIKQTDWFGPPSASVAFQPSTPQTPSSSEPVARPAPHEVSQGETSPSSRSELAPAYRVELPALRDYQLGPASTRATFTLLNAQVSPQSSEKDSLRVQVRMTNHDRFDHPFWDQSFRLRINGVPAAPESALDELVPALAAKEGTVIFSIPRGTPGGNLEINYLEDTTSIPLVLSAKK
ncbi:MAG: hypothetical protein JSS56_13000 [Proteobacteria bacterium]|nr:hypothetical protein [Pseudomonadota bacterium]